jgi:hypothetical protein
MTGTACGAAGRKVSSNGYPALIWINGGGDTSRRRKFAAAACWLSEQKGRTSRLLCQQGGYGWYPHLG